MDKNRVASEQVLLDKIVEMPEPALSGPFAGERLDPDRWEEMLDEYYRANGWDLETGWQTAAGLGQTGLEEVAARLRSRGRLIS